MDTLCLNQLAIWIESKLRELLIRTPAEETSKRHSVDVRTISDFLTVLINIK